ncbi:UNVERIFIED_CONTAM: hypothetical protein GTU68_048413 [Idotea baltica]|nr:hypothetical protein [Idotea baltica]
MFRRIPPDSTSRYTRWANNLTHAQLNTQIYTSNGPTVIMPTWFCHREVISRAGGFDEGGRGTPEDLMLFFRHLRLGADVIRVDQELLVYRYHREAATFSIHEDTIWQLRVRELEERVLSHLSHFTIWNAGKQGRKLFRSIREDFRSRVSGFCDVDRKKIGSVYTFEQSDRVPKPTVPILHFRDAEAPFIICVKMDLTGGVFEKNLESLNLTEGKDYFHFN